MNSNSTDDVTIILFLFALGLFLIAAVVLCSVVYLWFELRREVRALQRGPEVPRLSNGKRLKERL